jgi:hypothetical protein
LLDQFFPMSVDGVEQFFWRDTRPEVAARRTSVESGPHLDVRVSERGSKAVDLIPFKYYEMTRHECRITANLAATGFH